MKRISLRSAFAIVAASQAACIMEASLGVKATMQLPADSKADCYLELLEGRKDVVLESKKLHPPDNPFQRAFLVSPLPEGYRVRVRCEGFKQVYTSDACTAGMINRCGEINLGVLTFSKE